MSNEETVGWLAYMGGFILPNYIVFILFFRGSGVFFHFSGEHIFREKGTKIRGCCFRMLEKKKYLFQDLYSVDGGFDQVPNGCSSLPKKQISTLNVIKSVVLWYHNFEPLSNSPHVQRCSIGLAPNCQTQ